MSRGGWAIAAVLLLPGLSRADGLADERAEIEQRLLEQRLALDALKGNKVEVLEVLEFISRLARTAQTRSQLAQGQVRMLRRRIEMAEVQQERSRQLLTSLSRRLTPRLRAMYRLSRRNTLNVLLSASDFASLIWRSRAVHTLLQGDLALLEQTHQALIFQAQARAQLENLRESLSGRINALDQEATLARQEHEELADLLDSIQADASHRRALVHELEQSEKRLNNLIAQMETSAKSAFGQLKGQLPFPAPGMIEVGYGRIVNPRFNTVTVQKGLDIRALAGAPVTAVAPGKVVYAGWLRGYGNILILDHGSGFHTLMAHLASFARKPGEDVKTGDVVGEVGDTGSLKGTYLYFELRQQGQAVDPAEWLGNASTRR